MGRHMRTDPAVCPRCHADFECSGGHRYQVLKTHMKNVHGITEPLKFMDDAKVINNITNNYSNCQINNNITINVNIDGTIASREDMEKLLTASVRESINHLLNTYDSVVVKVFDALHCNPEYPYTHVANIPNKKKDEMLVVNKDGNVDIVSKTYGAKVILDKLENEAKLVDEVTDNYSLIDDEIKLAKSNVYIDNTITDIIDHLENNIPRPVKKEMEKTMRKRRALRLGIQ